MVRIVPIFFSRQTLSSGLARDRTAKIMQGNEVFRDLISNSTLRFLSKDSGCWAVKVYHTIGTEAILSVDKSGEIY
jgi:hypothetical protein